VSLEHLLEVYGYPALFAGTFLEGETPLLMASFLAHRGYLSLPVVALVGFAGAFAADQLSFYLGRSRGRGYLVGRPVWQAKAERAHALLQRYGLRIVVGFRFVYGLRVATPFVVGMTGFAPLRFLLLNAVGGAVWSVVITFLGYSLGGVLKVFLEDLRSYELLVILSIASISAIVWVIYLRRRSSAEPGRDDPGSDPE